MNRFARLVALASMLTMIVVPSAGFAAAGLSSGVNADDLVAAAAYCERTGGKVEIRRPEYGTNNPSPLVLSGHHDFCRYTMGHGSSESRIYVFLDTLYTVQPTLAALAYYAQVQPGTCSGNPASCYCTLLGGTDLFGGINAAGGAWVRKGGPDPDLDTCIFPDLSSIDSFGLFYHSAGIIRGIDLSKVLRYPNPNANSHRNTTAPWSKPAT
ncbi:MAG: hypothetical protein JO060_09360 [Candidatus Eremiobacteraeota bacterium]|nr:hypothetical protein [Candidatus Eremiobacteraeota bacterium]